MSSIDKIINLTRCLSKYNVTNGVNSYTYENSKLN